MNLFYFFAIQAVEGHKQAIISMSLKHRLMYTGSSDGTAKCWVTEFGDNTVTYKGHELSVTVLKFYKGLCKSVMIFFDLDIFVMFRAKTNI